MVYYILQSTRYDPWVFLMKEKRPPKLNKLSLFLPCDGAKQRQGATNPQKTEHQSDQNIPNLAALKHQTKADKTSTKPTTSRSTRASAGSSEVGTLSKIKKGGSFSSLETMTLRPPACIARKLDKNKQPNALPVSQPVGVCMYCTTSRKCSSDRTGRGGFLELD